MVTPVDAGVKLTKGTDNSGYIDEKHYQSVVGSLLYLLMRTRPDITFAVSCALFKANLSTSDSSQKDSEVSKKIYTSWVGVQKKWIQNNRWVF